MLLSQRLQLSSCESLASAAPDLGNFVKYNPAFECSEEFPV